MIREVCYLSESVRTSPKGLVVAIRPEGHRWAPAELGEGNSPLRVAIVDLTDTALAAIATDERVRVVFRSGIPSVQRFPRGKVA